MLVMSPYLFIDVFYVHEPPSEQNCCEVSFQLKSEILVIKKKKKKKKSCQISSVFLKV